MTTEPQSFSHEINADLASLIPDEVRVDPERLEGWVNDALAFGLKAMLQASVGIDTSVVNAQFDQWKSQVSDKLIGKDSEFETALSAWFNNSQGSFQQAFDINNKTSPLGKFKDALDTDLDNHQDAVNELIEGIQETLVEDMNEIKRTLGIETAVKEEAEKGTQKGGKFEEEVAEFLEAAKGNSDGIGIVGEMLIDGTKRKVGDVLVEIDSPGITNLKMILEVKAGADYTLRGGTEKKPTLPDQMTTAMQLRTCHGSIAVTDLKHLKKTQKAWNELDRHRILIAVDRDNEDFTLLEIAYKVLRYRLLQDASVDATAADALDAVKFNNLLKEILSRLETTTKMKRACTDSAKAMQGVHADITKLEIDIKAKVVELQGLIESALDEEEE
jgi:hypothetical protein